jgi:hypothetical protein
MCTPRRTRPAIRKVRRCTAGVTSTGSPAGAASPEAALARLRGLLPDYQPLGYHDELRHGEYINVYFNWEDQPKLADIKDIEEDEEDETDSSEK